MKILHCLVIMLASLATVLGGVSVFPILSPAGHDSGEPNLFADAEGVSHLTWCGPGPDPDSRALWVATLPPGQDVWSVPRVITDTPYLMENWADFASMIVTSDGAWTAQWFERIPDATRGYSGWFSRSVDRGQTWASPKPLGHEFVSLAPLSNGRVLSVWLQSLPESPAQQRPGAPLMELRSRLLSASGEILGEWQIDPDVCTCCQTALVAIEGDRAGVAYRGHTSDQIRDIGWATFDGANWSTPELLHADGWQIGGCPVNGPASDARNGALTVAWYTAAQDQPRVYAKVSRDGGKTFGRPLRIDLGSPSGRGEVTSLADGSAAVFWMERDTAGESVTLQVRRVAFDALSPPIAVAAADGSRRSGFPRAAWRGQAQVLVAWTEVLGGETEVRTAEVDLSALVPGPVETKQDSGLGEVLPLKTRIEKHDTNGKGYPGLGHGANHH